MQRHGLRDSTYKAWRTLVPSTVIFLTIWVDDYISFIQNTTKLVFIIINVWRNNAITGQVSLESVLEIYVMQLIMWNDENDIFTDR